MGLERYEGFEAHLWKGAGVEVSVEGTSERIRGIRRLGAPSNLVFVV